MSSEYVNGYYPVKVKVWAGGNFQYVGDKAYLVGATLRETIDMEACNIQGQPENWEPDTEEQLLATAEMVEETFGYRYSLTQFYNDLIKPVTRYKIDRLYAYKKLGYVFEIFPNAENLQRRFYMHLVSSLNEKIERNSENAAGIENIILQWRSIFLEDMKSYDPEDLNTPLDNFITL